MKNSLLLIAIMAISFCGISQMSFTVNNETGETLDIAIQVSNQITGDCIVVGTYDGEDIADGFSFNPTFSGSEYPYRIGFMGTSGSGFVFYDGDCGADATGPYSVTWNAWNEITVY